MTSVIYAYKPYFNNKENGILQGGEGLHGWFFSTSGSFWFLLLDCCMIVVDCKGLLWELPAGSEEDAEQKKSSDLADFEGGKKIVFGIVLLI